MLNRRLLYALPIRLRSLFRRRVAEAELDEEIQFHFERQMETQIAKGLSPEEARYAAMRTLGNTSLVKEQVRDAWGWNTLSNLLQDIRYAIRVLVKSPGFATTAILTLALGIAASTAIFTIIDSVVLKPLSYPESGNLVALWERVAFLGPDATGPNPRHVDVWRKGATAFRDIAIVRQSTIGLARDIDHPNVVGMVVASPNLFDVLQVSPLHGRTFLPEDGVPGRGNVVVLTYKLWETVFQSDPNVVGRSVRLSDVPFQVVGVLPQSFHFPNRNALPTVRSKQAMTDVPEPSIFLPLAVDLSESSWTEYGNWIALGRLKAGITPEQAQSELQIVQEQVLEQIPTSERDTANNAIVPVVQPMQEAIVGQSRRILWFLMAAVGGLMLIACLNLANTQLARTYRRQREASVRGALGAPKWRLVWQALLENLLIAAVAGALGVVLAGIGLTLFRRIAPVDLPRLSEVRLSTEVLLFAGGLMLISAAIVSVLPVLYSLRSDLQASLQQGNSRALGSRQRRGVQAWLIGFQVFGCTALLLITGLFSTNLLQLLNRDMGFRTERVAFAQVNLTSQSYGQATNRVGFIDAVLENVREIPGVQAAGFISAAPLEGEAWINGVQRVDKREQKGVLMNLRWASPGYFEALSHELIAGRFLEERDRATRGVLITEGGARSLWRDETAVGGKIEVNGIQYTVVGVVGDARTASLKAPPPNMVYIHYGEQPPYQLFFMVRGNQPSEALLFDLRQAIWKHAPSAPIARAKTLDSQVRESLGMERIQTVVISAFGIAALLIAMLGIYGILNYSVATRKQEIGLRKAVGATPQCIYRLTMGEVGMPIVAGLMAGLIAMVAAGRVMSGMLDGVEGLDPLIVTTVLTVFVSCAIMAGFLPAWQAASLDPVDALRSE
ncbi:MAG: ABC transporter permease [Bryobacterales bacterium]|nr:ABC transporter permease [Bryobacterales bacterium]